MLYEEWGKAFINAIKKKIYIINQQGILTDLSDDAFKSLKLENPKDVVGKSIFDVIDFEGYILEDGEKLTKDINPIVDAMNNEYFKDSAVLVKNHIEEKPQIYYLKIYDLSEEKKEKTLALILCDVTLEYESKAKVAKEKKKFETLSMELQGKCEVIDTLRKREKQHLMHLKDVLKNISEGILVIGNTGKINFCNNSFYEILGFYNLDIQNKSKALDEYLVRTLDNNVITIREFIDNYLIIDEKVERALISYTSTKESEVKYLEFNSTPVYDSKDKLMYTIITVKDITDIKVHEKRLEDITDFTENVINTMDVPIAVVQYPSLKIVLANKRFKEAILNIIPNKNSQILNDYLVDLFDDDEKKKCIMNIIFKCIMDKTEYILSPFKVLEKNGERFYKIRFKPYEDNNGDVVNIHIHGLDITDEINNNLELERMTKVKDDFFTVMSHELRTPLTIIYSSLQLAYKVYGNEITQNIDKILGRIDQNCSRLLKLINNILDISKAEAGFLDINSSVFDMISVTEYIITSVNSYAIQRGIELIFDTNMEEFYISLDKDKYEKILLNLLSNAMKFTPEGKQIYVVIDIQEERVIVRVQDQGVGIPQDKLCKIFDRYAQVNNSLSRRAEGTGLGLSLVKKLIEIMNGTIEVSSIENEGTSFELKFSRKDIESKGEVTEEYYLESMKNKIEIEFSDF